MSIVMNGLNNNNVWSHILASTLTSSCRLTTLALRVDRFFSFPFVGYFTSPDIDTRRKVPTASSLFPQTQTKLPVFKRQ